MLTEAQKARILAGEAAFEKGDYRRALRLFEDVLEENPNSPDALNDAGLAALELGEMIKAAQYFERALEEEPEHSNAFFSLLDTLLREDAVDLAIEAFVHYEPRIPDSPEKQAYALALEGAGEQLLREQGFVRGKAINQGPATTEGSSNDHGRYRGEQEGPAFFCLSTGRCGTQTLSAVLDKATNARVYHHPQPYLIEETLAAYQGLLEEPARTFWQGRGGIIRNAWEDGLVFGELDHNMTPFAPDIAAEIETAKFVVLVRNPWDFVRSGMRRGYYCGHSWDSGRLRPEPSHPDAARWSSMTVFEKVCWLWSDTYRRIQTYVDELSDERYLLVHFEDLVSDLDVSRRLFEFLSLEGFDEATIRGVLGKKLNQQTNGTFPKPAAWTPEQHETLWRICEPVIKSFRFTQYEALHNHFLKEVSARRPAPALSLSAHLAAAPEAIADTRIHAATIWDYKRFKHQPYPAAVDPNFFVQYDVAAPAITRDTPIASMGSCFARNVARHLKAKGYRYLVTEQPFAHASAHWDLVYNTASMRQIFEYTFDPEWQPLVRWWPKGDHMQDPFRRDVLYPAATAAADFEAHRAASRRALGEAEILILTLGLIETWRDRRDEATFYRVPSPSLFDADIHEFYVQTVWDCVSDLQAIHALLAQHNPGAHLIVTVSPVPLFATFRMDTDVVSANTLSKSTLRVAAEYFAQQFANVHYFPSYELVVSCIPNPFEADGRHVTPEAVEHVMDMFERLYISRAAVV